MIEFDAGTTSVSEQFAAQLTSPGPGPSIDPGVIEQDFARALAPQAYVPPPPIRDPENPAYQPSAPATPKKSYIAAYAADLIAGDARFDPGTYIQSQLDELDSVIGALPDEYVPLSSVYDPLARAYRRGGAQDDALGDINVKNPAYILAQQQAMDTTPSGSQMREGQSIPTYSIEELANMPPNDPRLQEPYFIGGSARGPVLTRPMGYLSAADEVASSRSSQRFYQALGGIVDVGSWLERQARAAGYEQGAGKPEEIAAYEKYVQEGMSREDAARKAREDADAIYGKLEANDPFAARASDLPLPTFGLPVLINALNPAARPETRAAAQDQLGGAILSLLSDPTNLIGVGAIGAVVKGGRATKTTAKELRAALGSLADHPRVAKALDDLALRPGAESANNLAKEIANAVGGAPNKELDNFVREQLEKLPDSHIQALAASTDPNVARNAVKEAERRGIPTGAAERQANIAEDLAAAAEDATLDQDEIARRAGFTQTPSEARAARTITDTSPEAAQAGQALRRTTEEASARRAEGAKKILDRALQNKYLPQNAPAVQAVRRSIREGVELTADTLLDNPQTAKQLEQALIGAGASGTGRRAQRALADLLIERETQRNVAIAAAAAKKSGGNAAADAIVAQGARDAGERAAARAKAANAYHVVEGKTGFFVEDEAGRRVPSFHKSREGAQRMADAKNTAAQRGGKTDLLKRVSRGEEPPPPPPSGGGGGRVPPAPEGTLMLPPPPPRLALPHPGPEARARWRFTQAQQRRWAQEAAHAEQLAKRGGPQTPAGAIARIRREIWRRAADSPKDAIALTPSGTYIAPPGYSQTKWNELNGWQKVTAVYNTTRVFKAMGDISATMRQGGVLLFDALLSKDPKRAARMIHTELVAFKDEKFAIRAMKEMESHPRFAELIKKSGTYVADWRREVGTDWGSLRKPPAREEEFQFSMADRIPGVGRVARASERSFSLYLNTQRWQKLISYVEGREALAARGLARPMDDTEYKALGRALNAFTGRGVVPQGAGNFLNALSFSIRFAVSRPQMYAEPFIATARAIGTHRRYGGVAARGQYELAKMEAKALGAHAAGMIGLLTLGHMAGFDVGLDRDSPDFLSLKLGHVNIDLTGGVRPYLTLLFRLKDEKATSLQGKSHEVGGNKPYDPSHVELLSRFVQSKLHPSITTALNTLSGEDIAGNPYGPRGEGRTLAGGLWDVGTDLLVPLPMTDIVDGMLSDGPIGAAASLVGTMIGGGVMTQKKGPVRSYLNGSASSPTPAPGAQPARTGGPAPTLPPKAGAGASGTGQSWWR